MSPNAQGLCVVAAWAGVADATSRPVTPRTAAANAPASRLANLLLVLMAALHPLMRARGIGVDAPIPRLLGQAIGRPRFTNRKLKNRHSALARAAQPRRLLAIGRSRSAGAPRRGAGTRRGSRRSGAGRPPTTRPSCDAVGPSPPVRGRPPREH